MRPADTDRTHRPGADDTRADRGTPDCSTMQGADADGRGTERRSGRRTSSSAPFGPLLPSAVAAAVVVAVAARALVVGADRVIAAGGRSTLVALGLFDSLGTVAATGALVARLGAVAAAIGVGYCGVSAGLWLYARQSSTDEGGNADAGRVRAGSGSRSR